MRAHDDGRGTKDWKPGHELRGMRERLEQLGGRLEIEVRPYQGFHLDAWIPLTRGAT